MNEIKIVSAPVIEYSAIDQIAEEVKKELATYDINEIVPTDENHQFLKKLRTEYKKKFDEYENARKFIKQTVNEPYELFEKAYKEKLASQFNEVDRLLKDSVDLIETRLKDAKKEEVKLYFDELCQELKIDFVKFEQVGLKIGLSETVKTLKENIKNFLFKVMDDLTVVERNMHYDRVLVQYKQTLDLSGSIMKVFNDVQMEEKLKAQREEAAKKVEVIETPVVEIVEVMPVVEEILTVSFTVKGTKEQLRALKTFMQERGLRYE